MSRKHSSPSHHDQISLFHALSCSLLALASQALGWQPSGESVPAAPQEFRAAWISTVHNIDWPSRSGLSGAAQRAELLTILNTCAQLKLNAVFLQVRPNADALYQSSLEPWSQWLSGPGVNPGYDPWPSPFRRPTAAALNCTPGSTPSGQRPM